MKDEVCRSNTVRVIAFQRSVDRRTDRQTDGQTDKVITIGLPHLRWRGPNNGTLLQHYERILSSSLKLIMSYLCNKLAHGPNISDNDYLKHEDKFNLCKKTENQKFWLSHWFSHGTAQLLPDQGHGNVWNIKAISQYLSPRLWISDFL